MNRALLLMGLIVSVFVATPARAAEWKIQTLFTPGTILYDEFVRMTEKVKSASAGRLVITPFPVGAISGPGGTLDAIRSGVLDGHYTWPGLWAGLEPGFAAIGDLAGGYDSADQQVEMMEKHGGRALLSEIYAKYNVVNVGVFFNGVESLPSRRAIKSPAELAGLKIRLPAGIVSDVFAKFGAAPVVLPLSEAFSALDKGVVDAADGFSLGENMAQGFYDIAKFTLYPGIHSAPILDFSVAKAKWDALPQDLKDIVIAATGEAAAAMLVKRAESDAAAATKLKAGGITLVAWSEENRRAFRTTAAVVWATYAERSALAKRAVELQTGYLKAKGLVP